ncbi:hypothetical protein [Methylobacter sp. YRD-M1]|uniref:hypothetical protein n=1 Tax=Methylobacter sp. YRD-M1 TaxID=2911520 RepID=UPI00227CD4C7|nr:hypothetical protein [Methylobacter sp. YRD-M1]WAK04389.1 hypothetical protein LZ558_22245 [Methylobacter sp. YRD-M1]
MKSEEEIRQFICTILQSNGWTLFDQSCTALSFKMYQSAVGLKEAQVYLCGGKYDWRLSGQYYSQGRNILSTGSVFIPIDCNTQQLYGLCMKFIENVESAIADSYAVRLFLKYSLIV